MPLFAVNCVPLTPRAHRLQDLHRGEPDRSHRRRRISRVSEHLQRQFDAIILHAQLHSRRSAFHAHAYTDDDGGYAGSVQRDPRQIRFDPRRIGR